MDKLKLIEADCLDIYSEAGDGNKQSKSKQLKYRFIPVETHQMMDHLSKRTEDEFKMPNMQIVSDDEEAIAESIR